MIAANLIADDDGSQVIEYSLLIAVLSIALTVSMPVLQAPLCTLASHVSNMLVTSAADACAPRQDSPGRRAGTNKGRGDGNGNGNGKGKGNGKGNGDTNGNGLGLQ